MPPLSHRTRSSLLTIILVPTLFGCKQADSCDSGDTVNAGGDDSALADGYSLVGTDQGLCYDDQASLSCPASGEAYHGQDAQYDGVQPSYQDNGDGTVTDLVTGLMWQQDPGEKMSRDEGWEGAEQCTLAGYEDWRLPSIKELYSLILFSGTDPSGCEELGGCDDALPFIDDEAFVFEYGDESAGERMIDAQYLSADDYVATTMNGDATSFGVNFADGRIKGYGLTDPGTGGDKTFFVQYVRGNQDYGVNDFEDQGDGTVRDHATGLLWTQQDSGAFGAGDTGDGALNWQQALAFCEDLSHAGREDWRLPHVKQLQSIADYTRSPQTTDSAALDPVFEISAITDEDGGQDYPFHWSSTTHANSEGHGSAGAYVAFGQALGWMQDAFSGGYQLLDAHGAGAQRSDPKSGDSSDYPYGFGPQGDVIRIYNHARCVAEG